ncbi:phosphopantetheine-binding protein [Actinospica durhamensis]|uniref:Phosphopantetheine-binding protein n=1 Tax=Actinospica durhamensis TaxID=1508375 RepID=A0A941IR28_9ACTN|nr:phosphopantetheine-binding protein [Actinospica durhamensis]MBR7833518.1 phosphopantetheine-binding protein [Actinospica durhamensis]
MDVPHAFRKTLLTHLPYADGAELGVQDNLRALGLDSMGVVQLLNDLEETFALELPDDVLTDETFDTVGSLWLVVAALAEPGQFVDA